MTLANLRMKDMCDMRKVVNENGIFGRIPCVENCEQEWRIYEEEMNLLGSKSPRKAHET